MPILTDSPSPTMKTWSMVICESTSSRYLFYFEFSPTVTSDGFQETRKFIGFRPLSQTVLRFASVAYAFLNDLPGAAAAGQLDGLGLGELEIARSGNAG